jgi:hypothetical protein
MRSVIFALAACVASAFAQAPPALPQDWSGITAQRIIINQGGIINPDSSVTCPAETPQCKVQTAFGEGQNYVDYSGNRTAYYVGPAASVSDFNVGKTYNIDSATHTCQSWCPIDFPLEPFTLGENATYQGKVNYEGYIPTDDWRWQVKMPIFKIVVQTSDMYLRAGSNIPVAEIDNLLGGALQNQTWETFNTTRPDASFFYVQNATGCPRGDDQTCGGSSSQGSDTMQEGAEEDSLLRRAMAASLMRLGHRNVDMIMKHFQL